MLTVIFAGVLAILILTAATPGSRLTGIIILAVFGFLHWLSDSILVLVVGGVLFAALCLWRRSKRRGTAGADTSDSSFDGTSLAFAFGAGSATETSQTEPACDTSSSSDSDSCSSSSDSSSSSSDD